MRAEMYELNELVGKKVGFCGVDNNTFCLSIDERRVAFEAVEDESDGYRSMLEEVREVPLEGRVFFKRSIADVHVESLDSDREAPGDFKGYALKDASGHTWLKIGTDYADDYYPCFIFEYTPPREERGAGRARG